MFQEEKRKTNYGAICLVCFFCCIFAFQFMKLGTTRPSKTSSIAVIDSPTSSDKLSDRREYWRERPPSTYCLKMSSFTKLATSPNTQKYESRPFASGGYNWTLIVYPKGNKNEDGDGQVSLYVQIDNSTLLNSPKEVYAEVKFFIYNRKEDKYLTYQGVGLVTKTLGEVWVFELYNLLFIRKQNKTKQNNGSLDGCTHMFGPQRRMRNVFSCSKPYWGQPRTKSYDEIANPGNGYLFDNGQILFGVDVLVTETFNKWEVFSFTENLHNRFYKWELARFSSLEKQFYVSDKFTIGGRNWALKVYPSGDGEGQGNSLSLYVVAADVESYDKIYLKAKLRIMNQKDSNHVEKQVESWSDGAKSWGFQKFVPLSDVKDTSKGLLVNDTLKVEVEFEYFSKTKYFPS